MKRSKWLIYQLVITLAVIGPLSAADLKDGFLGIPWGTDISALSDFGKIDEKNDVGYYMNLKKSYTVFDQEVPAVIYGFFKNKFFAVYIPVESIEIFGRLKKHIDSKYGSPRTQLDMKNEQRIYLWKYGDIKIKLKLYEKEGKMKLGLYYAPLSQQANKAQQEAFPEVKKPLFPMDERRLKDALDVMGF